MLLSGCPSPECPSGTVAMDGRCVDVVDMSPRADAFTPDVSGDAPGLDPRVGHGHPETVSHHPAIADHSENS